MTQERAIQILENLISINGDIIIGDEDREALEMAIRSLQQEQPDFPTTDEQVKEFLAAHPKVGVPNKYKTPDWLWEKQEQQEQSDKSLEEAADTYAEKHGFRVPYDGSNNYYDEVDVKASKEGFIAGAEWHKNEIMKGSPVIMSPENFQGLIDSHARRVEQDYKEQLLKEAVEGDYDCGYYAPAIFLDKNLDGIKDGDKVRILVLKTEEE